MTNKEKAERYDALMAAIAVTKISYQRLRDDCERRYSEAKELGIIGSYSKGMADGCSRIVADLERWLHP